MPKNDYSADAQDALELIDEFGIDNALVKIEGVLEDVDKPWLGEIDTEVEYPTKGVKLPLSDSQQRYYTENLTVKVTDLIYMEAVELTAVPEVGDRVLHNGEYWKIEAMQDLKPATVTVMYTLIVSR
jgi:hypothetical protein